MNFTTKNKLDELIRNSSIRDENKISPLPSIVPSIEDPITINSALGKEIPFNGNDIQFSDATIKTIPLAITKKDISQTNNLAERMEYLASEGVAEDVQAEVIADNRSGKSRIDQELNAQSESRKREEMFQTMMISFFEKMSAEKKPSVNSQVPEEVKSAEQKDSANLASAEKPRKKKVKAEILDDEYVDELINEMMGSASSSAGTTFNINMINRYTKPELTNFLKEYGLPHSGTKEVQRERLFGYYDRELKDRLITLDTTAPVNVSNTATATDSSSVNTDRKETTVGQGVKSLRTENKYTPFGVIFINRDKLMTNNILSICLSISPLKKVIRFKNRSVSHDFKNVILQIIKDKSVPDLSDLTQDDRDYLMKLLVRSRADVKMNPKLKMRLEGIREGLKKEGKPKTKSAYVKDVVQSDQNSLLERLYVLIGEVEAGNRSNPSIRNEMTQILNALTLIHKVLTPSQARDLSVKYIGLI